MRCVFICLFVCLLAGWLAGLMVVISCSIKSYSTKYHSIRNVIVRARTHTNTNLISGGTIVSHFVYRKSWTFYMLLHIDRHNFSRSPAGWLVNECVQENVVSKFYAWKLKTRRKFKMIKILWICAQQEHEISICKWSQVYVAKHKHISCMLVSLLVCIYMYIVASWL